MYKYFGYAWSAKNIISATDCDNYYPQVTYHPVPAYPETLCMIWTRHKSSLSHIMYNKIPITPFPMFIAKEADVGKQAESPYLIHRDGFIEYGDLGCWDFTIRKRVLQRSRGTGVVCSG
jgi:hypothetical protein